MSWWGDKMKCLRKSLNMTQEEFARRIDVSIRTYVDWEGGVSTPASPHLMIDGIMNRCTLKIEERKLATYNNDEIIKIVRALGQARYHLTKYDVNSETRKNIDNALSLIQEKL